RRREVLLQQIQRIRLNQRDTGWSADAWQLAKAAADIRRDQELRTQAAALLSGLDLERVGRFDAPGASSLAFDLGQQRLLLGGTTREPARVLDLRSGSIIQSAQQPGAGPVVFRGGSAVQLTSIGSALVLRDLAGHHAAVTCSLRVPPGAAVPTL